MWVCLCACSQKGFVVKEMFYSRSLSWESTFSVYRETMSLTWMRQAGRERHSKHLKPSQSWEAMQKHYGCRFVCVRLCFGDVCMCVWVRKTAVVHPKWHIPIKSSHWFDSGVCKVVFCVCVCAHQARGETNFSPWFWCLLLCDVLMCYISITCSCNCLSEKCFFSFWKKSKGVEAGDSFSQTDIPGRAVRNSDSQINSQQVPSFDAKLRASI